MKILLTCTTIEENHRIEDAHDSHYPLGLGYLHSYLESLDKGYEITTRFLNNVSETECMETLEKDITGIKPDIIGISMMTHSRVAAWRLIRYIKDQHPDIKIVVGGMHVSVMYKQIAEEHKVVCVIGEGEITLGELMERWENNEPIDKVNGIAYYDEEQQKVVVTPGRALIEDLDVLPFPKHDLFLWEGKRMAGLLTSRGCPYKCNFCVLDAASRRKVRCRSAKNIVDEVEMILESHPSIDTVWIHDDAFMIMPDRTIEFCKEVVKRGIKTSFVCSARFRPISREVVMLMAEAGFKHVLFGLESGSPSVMKLMKKGLTQKSVRHGLKLFSETGIKATAFLITGLPGENKDTVDETIDFVQELQDIQYLYYDEIGVAGIYPGTELFTIAKEQKMVVPGYGVIDDKYWLTDGDVPWYEVDHSYEQLLEWKEKTRDAIAFNRLMDQPHTFLSQRKLIPSLLKYSWQWGIPSMVNLINYTRRLMVESIGYEKFAAMSETEREIRMCVLAEKEMILEFFRFHEMKGASKKDFMEQWKKQVGEDSKTLSRWHTTQEEEKSGIEDKKTKKYSENVVTLDGLLINTFEDDGLDDERKRKKGWDGKKAFNILDNNQISSLAK